MNVVLMYAATGTILLSVGLSGVFFCSHMLRKILAANLASSGLFLLLIALARREPAAATDPVPQALVLTGIVVGVSATGVMLALYRRLAAWNALQDTVEKRQG